MSYGHRCQVCGYEWRGLVERPQRCPRCHSRKWGRLSASAYWDSVWWCSTCGVMFERRAVACPRCADTVFLRREEYLAAREEVNKK